MMRPETRQGGSAPRVCVAGASGYAGSACADAFAAAGWQVSGFSRRGGATPGGLPVMACADGRAFHDLLQRTPPDVLLVATGIAELDACERDPALSQQANVDTLDEWIATVRTVCPSVRVVLLSSIYVFGEQCPPAGFCESDAPQPLSVYGRHKWQAEQRLQASGLRHLIVRLPWLIGNTAHPADPVRQLWRKFQQGESAVDDGLRFPTDARWVAHSLAGLMCAGVEGVVHLSAVGAGSRFDLMAGLLAHCTPAPVSSLRRQPALAGPAANGRAPRPEYLRLGTCRPEVRDLPACPSWQQLAERYAASLCGQSVREEQPL
ncbi:sugar nucleotide-binding protein [Uliginosibacterium flavum]|uniref:dTDP-4-dehydrorhamnose reductase n=1 Tax=Uliginosibacterium flavum TaxID=1396831 RepID=A0ABV2TJN7_9RHOO